MADADWYRRTSWTLDDQHAFFHRLLKSRSAYHKAQYTRLQAASLQHVGTSELLAAALGLYEFVLREYPDEESQTFAAHVGRVECLADLGRDDEARPAIREALAAHLAAPRWHAPALLGLGRVAVRDRHTEVYPELYEVLLDLAARQQLQLPSDLYAVSYQLALMADHLGMRERARGFARMALRYASATDSPLRRYPQLGLVRRPSPVIQERLLDLAQAPESE